jgi:hypothetical protein
MTFVGMMSATPSHCLMHARGPPLTIVMNNPNGPKIHGAHNLQTDSFFISIYTVVGKGKDRILPRTQPHPRSCALLRRSRGQQKGACVHMVIYGCKATALDAATTAVI